MVQRLHIILLSAGRILEEVAFGGEERFTTSLGKWLARHNHDVTLLGIDFAGIRSKSLSQCFADDENKKRKKERKRKKKKITFRYLFYSFRLIIWIFQVVKILSINMRSPVTIIHAQDAGYTGLAAVVAGRLLKKPVIISLHGLRVKQMESEPINRVIKRVLLKIEHSLDVFTIKKVNNVIIISPPLKDYCEQITNKKIDIIPPAINLKNFEFSEFNRDLLRKELGIDKKTKVIGYVGRLSAEKNLLNMLIAFADAALDDDSIRLIVIGEGPLECQLMKYVSERHIEDKVMFCGVRSDVDHLISGFDIFVLPSYIEGLSIALLEAMANGRAIICSDIASNRELLKHNNEALLVNPNDPETLKQAIHLLCNDELLRTKLGCNAKIRVSKYDEDIVFLALLKYYEETLSRETENKK